MARAQYRLNQLPAITVLLLVLLATLPMVKVSSNTDTHDEPRATPAGATAMPAQPLGANAAIVPPVGANATTTAQRPIAQLIPPPDDLQSATFTLDENAMKTSPPRGVAPLATARYTTAEHVIVTTAAASTGGAPLPLGAQRIALTDGTPAWVTIGLTNSAPNEVALVRDGLIVTVASDLPVEMLAALAADVVIRW